MDLDVVAACFNQLQTVMPWSRIYYAVKANPNPELLKLFHEVGLGFEVVSPGELDHLLAVFGDLPPVLYTPNFAPREDYARGFEVGATVTLDSLAPLEQWPELFQGQSVFVRIDPGRGRGPHKFVVTAGKASKFGVPSSVSA